jgi:hypothetical protein
MRRAGAVLILLLAGFLASAAPAAAVTTPWQISASPTSLMQGQATQVTMTVVGGSSPMGLLTITAKAGFSIVGAAVLSTPPGKTWTASVQGSVASFRTTTDPQRLELGETARFAVTAVPVGPSYPGWIAKAYQEFTTSSPACGLPATPLRAFTIIGASTPTPGPTQTPMPTPASSSTPTPASGPTQASSTGPGESASPTAEPSATVSPAGSSGPSAAGSPKAGPGGSTGGSRGGQRSPGPIWQGTSALDVPALPGGGGSVSISGLDGLSSLGLYSWLVPGFFLGLPGLLVLLVALLQASAGAAFLPIIRRVLGGFGLGRRRETERV